MPAMAAVAVMRSLRTSTPNQQPFLGTGDLDSPLPSLQAMYVSSLSQAMRSVKSQTQVPPVWERIEAYPC